MCFLKPACLSFDIGIAANKQDGPGVAFIGVCQRVSVSDELCDELCEWTTMIKIADVVASKVKKKIEERKEGKDPTHSKPSLFIFSKTFDKRVLPSILPG